MSNDKFRQAENQFFLLKGQLETRRITREQFDAALKELMVQDTDGRYWTIGGDTGIWYVHDGKNWVKAQPPGTSALESYHTPPATQSRTSCFIILVGAGLAAIVLVVAVLGLWFASSQGLVKIGAPTVTTTPTVIVVPTIATQPTPVVVAPTLAPPSPTLPQPTTTLSVPTATRVLPTIALPTATRVLPTIALPTAPAIPTATVARLTPVPASPTTPPIPPGLYVTAMGMDQPQPAHGQIINFTVSFLNTSAGDVSVKWKVYIYRADNPAKPNTESALVAASFPPGKSDHVPVPLNFKIGATGNDCDYFFARVDTLDNNNKPTDLTASDGKVFEKGFSVCK
ncbi:MAG: hypothetical protein HZB51_33110 [Chloroflexi bacterium]|nr:hypothetical protein [Chloroflexota bacterium]